MSRHLRPAAFSLVLLGIIAVHVVYAQALDWLASEQGISITHNPGSSRLDAMGGLSICVPDESNKLDLYWYGDNLSALLWESDTRQWSIWNRTLTQVNDRYDAQAVRQRTRLDFSEYGGRMAWRQKGRRFLGTDYNYDVLGRNTSAFDDSKVRGPWYGVFGGQKIGRVVLGAGLHLSGDNQDLTTGDVFAIRHYSSGLRFVGSLAGYAGPIHFGLQTERQANNISGVSRDESRFHEDKYTWSRPIEKYVGSAIWNPSEALRGSFRARSERIDGGQDVRVSWSDRMPQNPGRTNFILRVGTFSERVRSYETGTRWELRPFESILLAAEGDYGRVDTRVDEGYNYKGSRRAQDTKERILRGGSGLSYETSSRRFRVGAEGWYRRYSNEDIMTDDHPKIVARTLEVRTGAEYFVRDDLALRGGYVRSADDENVDLPRSLGIGDGFTVGAGFLPRGGLYRLDAAVRWEKVLPNYDGNPRSEARRTLVSLGARFLL